MTEHLPTNEYVQALGQVDSLLREHHHTPNRTGYPTELDGDSLSKAAQYADDPNSHKPHVQDRVQKQQDQIDALETYRPNFIAPLLSERDDVAARIGEAKKEIRRNTPFFARIGKGFMTAASYVPGLDRVVASVEENQRAEQLHVGFNLEEWKKNPNSTTLEKANLIHAKKYGGSGKYEKSYKKSLIENRKSKDHEVVWELENDISDLKSQIKAIEDRIRDLVDGAPL